MNYESIPNSLFRNIVEVQFTDQRQATMTLPRKAELSTQKDEFADQE